jgi:hypothetical protein
MEYEDRVCDECGLIFTPKAHNGKYCSIGCRKIATNKKVLDRYYENKDRLSGATQKVCKRKGCKTILSRYNKEDICEAHKVDRFVKRLGRWGWDEDKLREEYQI